MTGDDYALWAGALHHAVEGGFEAWYYGLSRQDRDRLWELDDYVGGEMLDIVSDDLDAGPSVSVEEMLP